MLQPENVDVSKVTRKWLYDYNKQENDKVFEWLFPTFALFAPNQTKGSKPLTKSEFMVKSIFTSNKKKKS